MTSTMLSRQSHPHAEMSHDKRIERRAVERLSSSERTALCFVHVSVHCGELVLSGPVPSFHAKQAAQELVRDLPGVLQVVNELVVRTLPDQPGATHEFPPRG